MKIDTDNGRTTTNSGQIQKAQDFFAQGKPHKALHLLVSVSLIESKNLEYLRLLSSIQGVLRDDKNQLTTQLEIFKQSDLNADKITYLRQCLNLGEVKHAKLGLETMTWKNLNSLETLLLLDIELEILIQDGNVEKMYICQRKFETAGIVSARYYYSLALIDVKNSNEKQALDHLRHSLEIDPNLDLSWTALALLHHKQGDFELALGNLQKALDLNPFNQSAIKLYTLWCQDSVAAQKADQYLNFYLDRYTFDESVTLNRIALYQKVGEEKAAHCEYMKLKYYFGS